MNRPANHIGILPIEVGKQVFQTMGGQHCIIVREIDKLALGFPNPSIPSKRKTKLTLLDVCELELFAFLEQKLVRPIIRPIVYYEHLV